MGNWINDLYVKYGNRLRMETVEVQIANTTGMYYLPDDSILRNRQVVGFLVVSNPSDGSLAPDTGRPLISDTALKQTFLTLKCNNEIVLDRFPLLAAVADDDNDRQCTPLNYLGFTPDKSYVQIGNAASTVAAGESLLIHFYYVC